MTKSLGNININNVSNLLFRVWRSCTSTNRSTRMQTWSPSSKTHPSSSRATWSEACVWSSLRERARHASRPQQVELKAVMCASVRLKSGIYRNTGVCFCMSLQWSLSMAQTPVWAVTMKSWNQLFTMRDSRSSDRDKAWKTPPGLVYSYTLRYTHTACMAVTSVCCITLT